MFQSLHVFRHHTNAQIMCVEMRILFLFFLPDDRGDAGGLSPGTSRRGATGDASLTSLPCRSLSRPGRFILNCFRMCSTVWSPHLTCAVERWKRGLRISRQQNTQTECNCFFCMHRHVIGVLLCCFAPVNIATAVKKYTKPWSKY